MHLYDVRPGQAAVDDMWRELLFIRAVPELAARGATASVDAAAPADEKCVRMTCRNLPGGTRQSHGA